MNYVVLFKENVCLIDIPLKPNSREIRTASTPLDADVMMYSQIKKEMETQEQAAERRLHDSEIKIKYFPKISKNLANETPEQTARRLKRNEDKKKYRLMKRATEKPEEAALRRMKQAENVRRHRKMAAQTETPEQYAQRRIKEKAQKRRYIQRKQANETPEQAAERLLKRRSYSKNYRMMAQAMETPEESALRRLQECERARRKLANETPEKTAKRLLKMKEYQKKQREREQAAFKANEAKSQGNVSSDPIVKYENIDEEWDGSSTWSSFGTSERSYSRTSTEGNCSRTSTATNSQTIVQYNSNTPIEEKYEPSQDNGFFFEITEIINSGENVSESVAPAVVQDIVIKEEVDL